ncbi:D-alanyl-D-alanine carboxypeptidase [Spirulina sp. CCNP1310]|uniref:D-alanyl-D-alanine carboxypeptidase n=1 Tax=Spirulina sp. CCNP1310 TaxID=3110249 RepID=UPI002B201795|nr:D-alanyl-D-alanine carboxypeptidase [Spirulina sp. CCNP1310]MEA5420928.1 D-alanyl-D-alanine carboxypeptidase [Spirulina sp. CCNP1310]
MFNRSQASGFALTCLMLTGGMAPMAIANPQPEAYAVDAVQISPEPPLPIPSAQTAVMPAACMAQMSNNINSILQQPAHRNGKWGVYVESLATGEVLYSRNADEFFIPASNIKLFTTAAALQLFDPRSPIQSTNLSSWVYTTNQVSNNAYADTLFRGIGGAAAIQNALEPLGVNRGAFRQVDGSGLSRQNLATPRAIATTLRGMHAMGYGYDVFLRSLPVAGQSGTLTNRLRATPAFGIVHAKTGTLNGVRALSGYVDHAQFGTLIVSVVVNHPGQTGQVLVNGVDNIMVQVARQYSCNPV